MPAQEPFHARFFFLEREMALPVTISVSKLKKSSRWSLPSLKQHDLCLSITLRWTSWTAIGCRGVPSNDCLVVEDNQRERNRMSLRYHYGGRAWQRLRQMCVDLRQNNDDVHVYSRSSLLGLATIHCHLTQDYAQTRSEDHDATCSKGDACAKTFYQRSCYPDNLA